MSTNTAAAAANQSRFAALPGQKIPRSRFPWKFRRVHSFKAGDLVPLVCVPMLPGDQLTGRLASLCRLLSPLEHPMMDNLYLDWFAFFAPNRILWENWVRMQGERPNPASSVDFEVPFLADSIQGTYTIPFGGLHDGLSFPKATIDPAHYKISALPQRMYRRIWNDWFRDQTYQNSLPEPTDNGPDNFNDALLKRGKRHDYFSSALDAPQMGAGVAIPWDNNGEAPVYGTGNVLNWEDIGGSGNYHIMGHPSNPSSMAAYWNVQPSSTGMNVVQKGVTPSELYADVGAVSASLNAFRTAIVLQQMAELDKRGGTRYVEILRTRWNVVTRDDRLQRTEYVGGGSHVIGVTNVTQTSESTSNSALGTLAAYVKGGFADRVSYRAPEHGMLMIMVNVRAPLTYQQQLSRHWMRRTRYDFPEPLTMHLGEEPVYRYEMYMPATGADATYRDSVWGWQERWAADRYTPSTVTGMFASDHPQSLDSWHLAIDYGSTPPIHDAEWIKDNPPIERVVKFPEQDTFMIDFAVDGYKVSSMPVMSVPGLTRI